MWYFLNCLCCGSVVGVVWLGLPESPVALTELQAAPGLGEQHPEPHSTTHLQG